MAAAPAQALLVTRREHADGVWITELVSELRRAAMLPEVITIEEALARSSRTSTSLPAIVVNRVSDAAPPDEAKRAVRVFRCFSLAFRWCSLVVLGFSLFFFVFPSCV